jgi:hypothetical protein
MSHDMRPALGPDSLERVNVPVPVAVVTGRS